MKSEHRLLVVDDEPVVCESCSRIFGAQGFKVETSTDSREGLQRAQSEDYSAILVDMKMPAMDGIEFIEQLRRQKLNVPVIMITGYASVPSAAAAMRLGASDYIPKPFTPEEILGAVRRLLLEEKSDARVPTDAASSSSTSVVAPATESAPAYSGTRSAAPAPVTPTVEQEVETVQPELATEGFFFLDNAWMKPMAEGSVQAGAFLSAADGRAIKSVCLPRVGEVVYRGLPLAAFSLAGKTERRISPSPVTGEVVEINHMMAERPNSIWEDPCRRGWIARIRPTQFDADLKAAQRRNVVVANSSPTRSSRQATELAQLGCSIQTVRNLEGVIESLRKGDCNVVMLDAASFGNEGPSMIQAITWAHPDTKVIVVADPGSRWEAAYRAQKMFYYAVEPFVDKEIIDILDAAFRPAIRPAAPISTSDPLPETMSKIRITNRQGVNVTLLISGKTLLRHSGLGREIVDALHAASYPVEVFLGSTSNTLMEIMGEMDHCDRLLALWAEDTGRLPGSLFRDTRGELAAAYSQAGKKMVTLVIQPNPAEKSPTVYDARTTRSLAEHIAREMSGR